MSVLEKEQFDTLVQEVKAAILKESQGVGDVEVVNTLDDVYSLPALRGKSDVVEVPISLLSLPAEQASITANSAATKALSAAEFADNIAQHPTYIGEDNYVYQWNYELSVYEKTAIYVRGEGFSISKVFSSITEMELEDMTPYKDGSFFLINTDNVENPDNAKLYVLKNGSPTFLVDMSGAIGFTGKTPQFKIGTVTIGTSRSDCTAAVSSNGEVDADGNPIYLLNLKIPSIALSDLSSEEVSMLQSPAREMITELSNTNQEVQNAENLRISAEAERSNNESTRVSAEQARSSAELTRSNNESLREDAEVDRNNSEQTRSDNEQSRISQEALRKESDEAREANEGQRISNESERLSAESMRAEAEDSRNTAESLRVLAENAREQSTASAIANAIAATSDAQDTASHPTYIGTDNYVYKWNKSLQQYEKTTIYVRGEGFSISKVFASIDEMNAYDKSGYKEGDFFLINTNDVENPDNAKLYVMQSDGTALFLVDMSGAIGFTGKTPQLIIGNVTVGANSTDYSAAVTSNGETDIDGNPIYHVSIKLPLLAYTDLTSEQVAELQKPANDMIASLIQTNDSVSAEEAERLLSEQERIKNESSRVIAENNRSTAELERISAENDRISAESTRIEAENTRLASEQQRQENENSRNEDYQTIRSGALSATESANSAATKASNLPYIQDNTWRVFDFSQGIYINSGVIATGQSPRIENGTWWVFNDAMGQYYDTGQSVNSNFVLTRGGIESVLTGDITTHTHSHLRYVAQVYDVVPDLATLTSYTDELGEHNFLLGNDIYVADTSEPLGYALYKLGKTNDGQAWIRIPQVPEGYMMVLVKNG